MDSTSNRFKMNGSPPFREAHQSLLPRPTTSTSPLLSLPGEIRNRIYALVFCEGEIFSCDLCEIYSTQEQPQTCSLLHGQPKSLNPLKNVCKQLRHETEALAVRNRTFLFSIVAGTLPVRCNLMNTLRHSIHRDIDFKWLRNVVFVNESDDSRDSSALQIMKRDLRPIVILCSQIPHVQVKYYYDLTVQRPITGRLTSVLNDEICAIITRGINLTWIFQGKEIISQFYPNLPFVQQGMSTIGFRGQGKPAFPQVANLRVFPLINYNFTSNLEHLLDTRAEDFRNAVSLETRKLLPGVWRAYLNEWKTNGIGSSS